MEKRIFNKGMNNDLAVEFIPQGQYRTALNVRVGYSDNDNMGTVENALGNTEVTSIDIPYNTGVYKCIGSKLDATANKIYAFLFNSIQAHRIIEYDISTNSISTVLESSVLNFDPDFLITGIAIVYLESDVPLLYWTDGGAPNGLPDPQCGSTVLENPIRKLNINKAKEYMLGNPNPIDAYQTIDVQIMDYIKWPPVFSPSVAMINDTTTNKNNIKGNLFQFRTAWRYDDFEKTAWSPISKVVNPINETVINNTTYLPTTFNNAIDITFDTGSEVVDVLYVAVRRSNNGGADTEGDFYLVDTLNKYDENGNVLIPSNSTYTYRFYNDRALLPIPLREQDLEFDNIPIYAQALEYIYGNRMVSGNYAEQFDLPTPDIFLTNIEQRLPEPATLLNTIGGFAAVWSETNPPTLEVNGTPIVQLSRLFTIPNPYTYGVGTVLQFSFSTNATYVVTQADINNISQFITNIVNYINTQLPSGVFISAGQDGFFSFDGITYLPLAVNQFVIKSNIFQDLPPLSISIYSFDSGYSNWLSGFNKTFGLRYYDRGNRATSVITDNNFEIKVPSVQGSVGLYLKRNFIGWGINHTPPIYATHYQWVVKYSAPSFIDFSIRSVSNSGTQTELSLEPIIDYSTANPSSILSYNFTAGDRCQFLTTPTGAPFPNYIDVAVNAFDEGTSILSVDQVDFNSLVITAGALVRIYTPQPTLTDGQSFFYEFGKVYEIGDAGLNTRYHKGETQDQTPTLPATGIFDRGDVWIRPRRMATTNANTFQNYWVEDRNFSDFYSSIVWDKGRASIFNPDFKRVIREANIGYSEPFIPETNLNGLSRIYDSSFRQYERKYRGIQLLKNKNRNLTVFQELKTGMLMINQQVARDSNGGTFVLQTDDVLNPMTYYEKESGIGKNPESYAEDRGNMYYVDVLRGEIIRLGQDGMNVISDRGMHNYFKDLLGQISKSGKRVNIYGCFNKRFGQYEIAFEQTRLNEGNNLQAVTLAYFEPENYWSSFYSYNPENMCNANDDMVSFKNGRVWVHNTGQYANYYGTQYVASLKAVSNAAPSETKVYETFTVEGTQAPNVPSIQSSLQQNSLLTPQMFRLYEGKYYTNFKRDLGTVGVQFPLLNGNRLRGRWLVMNIEMGTNTFSRLYAVNFNFVNSPINGI